MAGYAVLYGRAWTDEATYIVKAWWYINGLMPPYSDRDATWYMPLFFYQLGLFEKVFGTSLEAGRTMSAVIGGLSGGLLFLICRRLTGNAAVALLTTAIYLLTPTTAYYFATAAPLATVACLTLLAVWLILIAAPPGVGVSAALGLTFWALFFYRQNMILAVGLLAPLYIFAIGRKRVLHTAIVAGVSLAASIATLLLFPAKLGHYAARLPGVVPILDTLHMLPRDFQLIQTATDSAALLRIDLASLSWENFAISFLLPYLGTIVLALLAPFASRKLGAIFAAAFFTLAITHFIGSAGYCSTCALMYTNYFVGVGAVDGALVLVAVWQACRARALPAMPAVVLMAAAAIGLNAFGSLIRVSAQPNPYRLFPEPMLHQYQPVREAVEIEQFAQVIAGITPADKPVLVLHTQPALAYAVFRAGRQPAVQSLNIRQSFRELRPDLDPLTRNDVLKAVAGESLWTRETLQQWLNGGFDTIVLQEGSGIADYPTAAALELAFDLRTRAIFLGWSVAIYTRKPTPGVDEPAPTP